MRTVAAYSMIVIAVGSLGTARAQVAPPVLQPCTPAQIAPGAAPFPTSVRVAADPLRMTDETPKDGWDKAGIVTNAISLSVAALVALIGLGFLDRRRKKKEELEERLNAFHRPMIQALDLSRMLHESLNQDKPKDFRALTALLGDGTNLDECDRAIMREIVDVGRQIEKCVEQQAHHIQAESLRSLIAQLVRHLRFFRLAVESKLSGSPERYAMFVYPREVNGALQSEYDELRGRVSGGV